MFHFSELPDDVKKKIREERHVTLTRVGDSIFERSIRGGVQYDVTTKLNEIIEWKDREFHLTVNAEKHENCSLG